MNCKLCLQQKPLIKHSHIIPNFMYKPLLDGNAGMASISLQKGTESTAYTGEFEADILCQDCEGKMSKWESYAHTVLYGGKLPRGMSAATVQHQKLPDGAELFTFKVWITRPSNYSYFRFCGARAYRAARFSNSFLSALSRKKSGACWLPKTLALPLRTRAL